MPAPPAVASSPSTPDAPASPPATHRPTTPQETGPVFLDEDDVPPAQPGSTAPPWNADAAASSGPGFGAPPSTSGPAQPSNDPRGGDWRDPDLADTGAPAAASTPATSSPEPGQDPAPDPAEGPLAEHTFRVRRPPRGDAAPTPANEGAGDGGNGDGDTGAESEPGVPAQGVREFTVGLRRSDVHRGGPPVLPAQGTPGIPGTAGTGPAPGNEDSAPNQQRGEGTSPPPGQQGQQDQRARRIPEQGRPVQTAAGQATPVPERPVQGQGLAGGLVPGQGQSEAQGLSQAAHAAPVQQGPPPSWAQQPPPSSTSTAPDSAQAQSAQPQAQSPAAAAPSGPAGGPDAVMPWRPPANDPFALAAQQQARPGGLGKRLGARLVDLVLTLAVGGGVAFPLVGKATDHIDAKVDAVEQAGETKQVWLLDGTTGAYLGLVLGALVLFGLLYEVLPTARWGRTLGKKLFGLSVVHIETHNKPGFGAALARWLVGGVLALAVVGLLNVLWCVFDRPWRQCWHDKLAHTFVAKADSTEVRR